jgi:hypothetical protein
MLAALLLAHALITFIPMYATPTARQLPVMLGAIAGVRVAEPPAAWLGGYITPGDVAKIDAWLRAKPARSASAFVISLDMLAYGGLDPSRVPGGVTEHMAIARLAALGRLRDDRPHAWIGAFGTVMRLEPTAVEPVGAAIRYSPIAQPPTWRYIWRYARLHDPPLPSEAARAAHLRELIGSAVLQSYLATRARDRHVDEYALRFAADGVVNRIVMGADDGGPAGLHVKDVRALQDEVTRLGIAGRASVEPGADELGGVLVAHALARAAHWTPRIAVRYSTPQGRTTQDPLEFAPIGVTIGDLIRLAGGIEVDQRPDITLYVRAPHTTSAQDTELLGDISADARAGHSVALVDLTFLTHSYGAQAAFARTLLHSGIAPLLDAYSSWNTDANSTGIALAEAIAAGAGRRMATYDPLAHAQFMLDRFIDDYLYHDIVRPELNAGLTRRGITSHWYLAPEVAARTNREMQTLMDPLARKLLRQLYPADRAARLRVFLPWPRTDELESEIRLVPRTSNRSSISGREDSSP